MPSINAGVTAYKWGKYAMALREWRPLAEQGNAKAQYNLGLMYRKGQGVAQDDAEAVGWWRKAAEQGNARAQRARGIMDRYGYGVAKDFVLAHMWYNLAAAQGNFGSGWERGVVAKKMTPAQISEAQKLAREWRPK